MNFPRLLLCSGLLLVLTPVPLTWGQTRRHDPPARQYCEAEPPLTKLEDFDNRMQTIIVRGSTHVSTLPTAHNAAVRVDAIELRDQSNGSSATGVVVELRDLSRQDATHPADESRSYIDYEEIDRTIKAWDQVVRSDDTITKLNNFESRYRTKGDLEIAVFRQTSGGSVAASISGGLCERVRIFLSLDELVKLRHMIVQAKERLDEMK
ncbi:MAG: hypothetical protein M3R68_03980 [Acidobacteriota bacterium]|nr:hypothetical protein [Acidobacteriota bacterium]